MDYIKIYEFMRGIQETFHFFKYFNTNIPQYWNEPALTDFDGKTNYSYGEMAAQMARLQTMLRAAGLEKGDKIAICSHNCANWCVAFLSICANQGVTVSLMDAFPAEDIQRLLNHSDAKAIFCDNKVWNKISNTAETPALTMAINTENFELLYAATDKQKQAYEQKDALFQEAYPQGYAQKDVNFPTDNLDDLMIINYTSGTSGNPKGVMLTYRNLSANVLYSQERIPNHPGWNEICMLPLAHMFGLSIEFLYQVAGGCHVFFLSKLSPSLMMKAYAEVHPYMILTVPLVLEKIFKSKIFPLLNKPLIKLLWHTPGINKLIGKKIYDSLMTAFGGKLVYLITGGAAMNAEAEKILLKIKFPFTVGYGMTECGPLISYEDWQNFVPTSCGKIVYRNELKIDSADPLHQVGEIMVKGEHVMKGYYKNEEATQATIEPDGWLHTGDLGLVDKDGNIYIKGRSKNMILSSNGQNIYPEELEDKINNNLFGVLESVVIDRNSKLVALVYPDYSLEGKPELQGKTLEQIMEEGRVKLNKQLPTFAQITKIELMKEEFQKTPKQTIKRYMYK